MDDVDRKILAELQQDGRLTVTELAGRVRLRRAGPPAGADVLLVDDIVTTGATATESVRVLRAAGHRPCGVLVIAAA